MPREGKDSVTIDGKDVTQIDPLERDKALDLHSPEWGARLTPTWKPGKIPARRFYRDVNVKSAGQHRKLRDHLLRFPSAPIYGINRKRNYEVDFTRDRPNLHTLRLFVRPTDNRQPVTRLFIFHNGLNEAENLRFFYQLSDWILKEDKESSHETAGRAHRSACLLAPFPAHLMHFPFAGPFAQTPLARYLEDAGDLFRHFMRYMVEMRWLLGMINPQPAPAWTVGGHHLEEKPTFAASLLAEWEEMRQVSFSALTPEADTARSKVQEERVVGPAIDEREIDEVKTVLRWLLRREHPAAPETLPIHVVGYSLGGFVAQSVFFAWPNVVSSCSTICSGGAIRALSPTAFAHSEEWQSVLHSLRPEIEGSMLARKIKRDDRRRIAGMPGDQFGYFHRIFNQVFLQEDQASYKQRLAEYGPRMLFISGGDDPIVKPKDVLDASPDKGITMLSVARLTHFLGEDARSDRETAQRQFWLPEAGGLIARAAGRAEELQGQEFSRADELRQHADEGDGEKKAMPQRPRERDLASPDFEQALDWVVDAVEPGNGGWLFVCRNGIPTAFLSPPQRAIQAAGLHHHDVMVQEYVAGLDRRAETLWELRSRMTLCLSNKLEPSFIGSDDLFDPHSDSLGLMGMTVDRYAEWDRFIERWGERVRWFQAGLLSEPFFSPKPTHKRAGGLFAQRTADWVDVLPEHLTISRLPDVWISIRNVKGFSPNEDSVEETIAKFVRWVGAILAEKQGDDKDGKKGAAALKEALEDGRVRIVGVSGTELNPRYRGRFEGDLRHALRLLTHCAASLVRTTDKRPAAAAR